MSLITFSVISQTVTNVRDGYVGVLTACGEMRGFLDVALAGFQKGL